MARYESPRYQTSTGQAVWWDQGNIFFQAPEALPSAIPLVEALTNYLLFKASVLECEEAGYAQSQQHLIVPGETPDVHSFLHKSVELTEVNFPAELLQLARDHGARLRGGELPTGEDKGLQFWRGVVQYNREYHLSHL